MLERLKGILSRYNEITELLSQPDIFNDRDRYAKLTKEHADIEETAQKYLEYLKVEKEMNDAFAMAESETDKEMKDLLNDEGYSCKEKLASLKDELKILLLPKDKDDDKNVVVEIRGGAGGEEANLFAQQLYYMYQKYCDKNRFKIDEVEKNETELGGLKEVVFSVSGKGVFSKLKYESGVHRVQRVPSTESQGRVHTSTVTVAVLPEPEDVDVKLDEKDLRIDTCRSSGAGGQHINKTESCIRITHIPTGIVVMCQDERSQGKNKEKAFKVLKSRLYDYYNTQYQNEYQANRRSQVGTGDRSERIRTYNFPQGRVTDHRIGFSMFNIDGFMQGDIGEMIEALAVADREAQLAGQSEDN